MGGPGSGNFYHWWRPSKKTTTEECLSLDAGRWTRDGVLRAGVHLAGTCRWTYRNGHECSIGWEVCTLDAHHPWVRLHYVRTDTADALDYHVRLTTTRPHFGGLRWWFFCPLTRGD